MGDEHQNIDGVRGPGDPESPDVTDVDLAARLREKEAAERAREEEAKRVIEESRRKAEEERRRRAEEQKRQEGERRRAESERRKAEEAAQHPAGSNRLLIILTVIGVVVLAGLAAGYFFYVSPGKPPPTPTPTPSLAPSIPTKPLPPIGPAEEE